MSASGKIKTLVTCPRCKFPNSASAFSCLTCGAALPVQDASPRAGVRTQRIDRAQVDKALAAGAPAAQSAPAPPPPPPKTGVPRAPTDLARAVAWLICDPLPPVPVIGPVVTIGRAEDSNLVLAHSSVSRGHAIIRVLNDTLLFEDRSTYGSYVNGERQVSVPVKPGDVITVGPYDIRIVAKDRAQPAAFNPGETRPFNTNVNLNSADAMTGRLEKQPLAEVLQTIEFNRKTGTLDLVCGDVKGMLVVYEGMPIHASFGAVSGEEAVHEMVAQGSGYYAFRTKIEAGEQTIQKTMTALLLEASRRIDERPS